MKNGDFRAETGDFRGFPREMACGNRKTSDFFDGKFRGFCHKHPMFYAKKSGVLGVPKGDFRCFHPLAPSIFSDMPQKNVHFRHTAMGKYTRNYQMNLRLQGLYGFGVSPKNIHTDYTDYMVGGVASKYIHTDYTDIWLSFTIRMGCDNNGNNTENKANATGPERPEWGVHCFTIMPLCHQFPNQV